MNIRIEEDNTGAAPRYCRFTAIDDDTYDGAEDSRRSSIGYGSTATEAALDLIEIMYDACEITEDEARELMALHGVRRGMWHWGD